VTGRSYQPSCFLGERSLCKPLQEKCERDITSLRRRPAERSEIVQTAPSRVQLQPTPTVPLTQLKSKERTRERC
jgi:hypothetical protein